jgi:hypothetical protein
MAGAERLLEAQLAGPRVHRRPDHAGHTDHRDRDADDREERNQDRDQPHRCHRLLAHIVEGLHAVDRLLRLGAAHGFPDRGFEQAGRKVAAHEQSRLHRRQLAEWHVGLVHRRVAQALAAIRHHANHGEPLAVVEAELAADGAAVRPSPLRHAAIDDSDRRCRVAAAGERPATDQFEADGVEVIRRHHLERHRRRGPGVRLPVADFDRRLPDVPRVDERQRSRDRSRRDARDLAHRSDERLVERGTMRQRLVLDEIRRDPQREHVAHPIPGLDPLQVADRTKRQAGADQQRERDGNLHRDQAAEDRPARPLVRLRQQIGPRQARHRRQHHDGAAHRGNQHRQAGGEEHRGTIEGDLAGARGIAGGEGNQPRQALVSQRQSGGCSGSREQQRFNRELLEQTPSPGAERHLHGDTAAARQRAGEQQRADTRAQAEQEKDRAGDQHRQGRAEAPGQIVLHRHRRQVQRGGTGVALRMEGADAGGRPGQVAPDRVETGRLMRRDAREGADQVTAAIAIADVADAQRAGGGRKIDVGFLRKARKRRQHADDRVRAIVHLEDAADHRRIALQFAAPVTMAEDDHTRCARHLFAGKEAAAHQRRHADHVEEVGRDDAGGDAERLVPVEHDEVHEVELGHPVEAARLGSQIADFDRREQAFAAAATAAGRGLQPHQAVGFGVRRRLQQHGVEDAEHRGRHPDAEREGEDDRQRGGPLLPHLPGAGFDILPQRLPAPRAPAIAIIVLVLRHAAELTPGQRMRRQRRHAELHVRGGLHVEMELQLLVELLLEIDAAEQRPGAEAEPGKPVHVATPLRRSG